MFEALEGHLSEISLPVLSWVNPSTLGWGRLDVASWVMGGAKGTGSSDSSNRFWSPFPVKSWKTIMDVASLPRCKESVAL